MIARWLAAVFLGLPLSMATSMLLVQLWPAPAPTTTLAVLIVSFLVWIGAMAAAFAFSTSRDAWLWLGGTTAASFALVFLLKAGGGSP